jgi:hypothetical protein
MSELPHSVHWISVACVQTSDSGLASYVAGQIDRSLSWKDVKWLQTITKLPILVKGVMTAEDTKLALQAGVAGIIVSNHGARQLDYVPATISALEEVCFLDCMHCRHCPIHKFSKDRLVWTFSSCIKKSPHDYMSEIHHTL